MPEADVGVPLWETLHRQGMLVVCTGTRKKLNLNQAQYLIIWRCYFDFCQTPIEVQNFVA